MKLTAIGDPTFETAIQARDVLYNFLALKTKDMRPRRSFRLGNHECLRPSAEMLTSLEVNPDAHIVDIPPLYDAQPFETAIRQSQGQFAFTVDNEVFYFMDRAESNGFDPLPVRRTRSF